MLNTLRFTLAIIALGLFLIFGLEPENIYAKVGLVLAGISMCVLGGYYSYIFKLELDQYEKGQNEE